MTDPKQITDYDLNAYVDGELDQETRILVEDWLQDHPEDKAKLAAYQAQNDGLHGLFDPLLQQPLPLDLEHIIADKPRRIGLHFWQQLAAAVLLVILGIGAGWGLRGANLAPKNDLPRYVQRALGAHLVYTAEVLHPVEVEASKQDHLVAWLSKRLGSPLKAPDLNGLGYALVGGRLLEEEKLPAAQFMYENNAGGRVTVYLRRSDGKDTAFKFYGGGDASAFYWVDGPFSYALTGDMTRDDLIQVARVVYQAFTL